MEGHTHYLAQEKANKRELLPPRKQKHKECER